MCYYTKFTNRLYDPCKPVDDCPGLCHRDCAEDHAAGCLHLLEPHACTTISDQWPMLRYKQLPHTTCTDTMLLARLPAVEISVLRYTPRPLAGQELTPCQERIKLMRLKDALVEVQIGGWYSILKQGIEKGRLLLITKY
jgi:hypothetical protein